MMPGGETLSDPSGWTPDLLFIHLQTQLDGSAKLTETQFNSIYRLLDERYSTQTKALDAAFVAAEKAMTTARTGDKEAIQAALLAAKEAVEKANTANEKRFENVNEFRGQLADMQSTLISRNEAETRFVGLDEKMNVRFNSIEEQVKRIQTAIDRGSGSTDATASNRVDLRGTVGMWVAMGGMALTMIIVFIAFINMSR